MSAKNRDGGEPASPEALWAIVRKGDPDEVGRATLSRHFTEDMALYLSGRSTTPPEVLGYLAGDVRFRESYKLKRALCGNPRTPQRTALSLLKFLRIFDLADLTRDQRLAVNLRQKIEHSVTEKLRSLPSGVKVALARRANSTLLMELMKQGDEPLIRTCLDSPVLTEGHLYAIINMPGLNRTVITLVAHHPRWSLRYLVRYALIRNFSTPMHCATRFIRAMKTQDLKDLYADPGIPLSTRPFIFRELLDRSESTERSDETFDLPEDGEDETPWEDEAP